MMPARSRPRLVPTLAITAMLAFGCSGAPLEEESEDDEAARVAAIVEARAEVVDPAQALGTAAAAVTAALEDLVARPGEGTVDRVRDTAADLDEARADVEALALPEEPADLRSAQAALDAAEQGAQDLRAAVVDVADAAEVAEDIDEQLDAWVAAWDEPGSRSQLLARFEEVAAEAEALATNGPSAEVPATCDGPVAGRQDAAGFVAEATGELREFVAGYDGNGFDARRAELTEAPWGTDEAGVVRGPGASIDPASCEAVRVAERAAGAVAEALRDLQSALNPSDLAK